MLRRGKEAFHGEEGVQDRIRDHGYAMGGGWAVIAGAGGLEAWRSEAGAESPVF